LEYAGLLGDVFVSICIPASLKSAKPWHQVVPQTMPISQHNQEIFSKQHYSGSIHVFKFNMLSGDKLDGWISQHSEDSDYKADEALYYTVLKHCIFQCMIVLIPEK